MISAVVLQMLMLQLGEIKTKKQENTDGIELNHLK